MCWLLKTLSQGVRDRGIEMPCISVHFFGLQTFCAHCSQILCHIHIPIWKGVNKYSNTVARPCCNVAQVHVDIIIKSFGWHSCRWSDTSANYVIVATGMPRNDWCHWHLRSPLCQFAFGLNPQWLLCNTATQHTTHSFVLFLYFLVISGDYVPAFASKPKIPRTPDAAANNNIGQGLTLAPQFSQSEPQQSSRPGSASSTAGGGRQSGSKQMVTGRSSAKLWLQTGYFSLFWQTFFCHRYHTYW